MKAIFSLFFICGVLSFFGCKKDDVNTRHAEFWECHNQQNWDSVSIRNAIPGTWTWQYVNVISQNGSSSQNTNAYKGLEIELLADR